MRRQLSTGSIGFASAVILAGLFSAINPVGAQPAAAQVLAQARNGRPDVPRVELAARLVAAGLADGPEFRQLRENAARELTGRPDGQGAVSTRDLDAADAAIARAAEALRGGASPTLAELARRSGRPQIPGLTVVYLTPLGDPAAANPWRYILAHQTEGPAGSARRGAAEQAANPTRRGVTIWVETDGTVYWATAENAIPTHGDGANRNDNKYVDNSKTYRRVLKDNTIGVEFAGNFPDVARPPTAEQARAWAILVRFLQERYRIPAENIYAHNWIDHKDARYCEGCALATQARELNYAPGASQ